MKSCNERKAVVSLASPKSFMRMEPEQRFFSSNYTAYFVIKPEWSINGFRPATARGATALAAIW